MTAVRESRISRLLPAPAKIGHVPAIDGLRAIAVLAVIVYHTKPSWLPGGLTGVDIFFAISGFVVPASILWRDFAGPRDALLFFYTRRLFRIFPALILMLVATSLAVFLFVPQSWLGDGIVQTALSAFVGASNIVLYGLEGDYFSPRALFNPFLHTWSLGVEEQFYVVFSIFLFVLCFSRRAWARGVVYAALLILTALSLVSAAFASRSEPVYAFYLLPPRFWELGIGVLAYLALRTLVPWLRGLRPAVYAIVVVASIAGLLVPLAIGSDSKFLSYPFPVVLPCILSTALLMAVGIAKPQSLVAKVLSLGPLRYIGLISYSLYLWHWPVFVLLRWTSGFTTPAQIGIGTAASLVLAVLSYHLVETPLRSFASKSKRPRRVLITAALGTGAVALGLVFGASKARDFISLSVTADAATWYPYKIDAKLAQTCKVDRSQTAMTFGRELIFVPACRGKLSGRTLFVAGDSHALALTRMLEGFAATTGMKVSLFARPGCVFVFPREPVQESCRAFIAEVLGAVGKRASDRDVLFLPGLRVPRQIEADGEAAEPVPALSEQDVTRILADALALLAEVSAHKVPVIVEAPQPTFPAIPFRCSDWFNRDNPSCRGEGNISRAAFDKERGPLLKAMTFATNAQSNISIWDPSSIACDDKACRLWVDGKPMVFDGDHASGFADDRMLPGFRDAVLSRVNAP